MKIIDVVKVDAIAQLEVELTKKQLASALFQIAYQMCNKPDDAGCDWVTDHNENTYIGWEKGWKVSSDPIVAKMIDVYNYLCLGRELKMEFKNEEEGSYK